jgi:hypothetical protein
MIIPWWRSFNPLIRNKNKATQSNGGASKQGTRLKPVNKKLGSKNRRGSQRADLDMTYYQVAQLVAMYLNFAL